MSFVVTTVIDPSDVVGILVATLVGNTDFLVLAKARTIEIYSIQNNDQVKLERILNLYETILDIKKIHLFNSKVFLVITTDSNKIVLVGFKSLKDEFVLEEFDINNDGNGLSIQPRTLTVDPLNQFLGVFTVEGLFFTYDVPQKVSTTTEWTSYIQQKKIKKPIFKKPSTSSFPKSGKESRTPMIVETISELNDSTDSFVSVLYRDDLFHYYLKTFTRKESKLSFFSTTQFPEEIKPNILSLGVGFILFGKTGIYLKSAPYYDTVLLSTSEGNNENSTIEVMNNETKLCCIKKSLPRGKAWEVTSSCINILHDDCIRIFFSTGSNELYVSDIKIAMDPMKGELKLTYWKIDKIEGFFNSAKIIQRLRNDTIISYSTNSLSISKINVNDKSFKIIQEFSSIPPVLDFNISGTDIPKIQVCGGQDLSSGFINTEFKGFEFQIRQIGDKVAVNAGGVLNFWMLGEYFILNLLDGIKIYKLTSSKFTEINEFHGLEIVDGNVLDMNMFHNELSVVTEKGIFVEGKVEKHVEITAAYVQSNGCITYVTGNSLIYKREEYSIQPDVSTIFTLEWNRVIHILTGHWDGSTYLYLNGTRRFLKKAELAINSVLIKKMGRNVLYFTGDAEGHINVFDSRSAHGNIDMNIGDAPVTLVDHTENSILAYNAENVFKIVLDQDGNIMKKGYLQLNIPDAMKYDTIHRRLINFTSGVLSEVKIHDEMKLLKNQTFLPSLVRKSVKFKNFLHLSLFALTSTKYNQILGREIWNSELRIIDNNTFETKSVYKFDAGIEITDVVNTEYRKELIDTYEEENIRVGMENVLSQCFVVSCAYGSQDEYGPPLMLFSVDEFGQLQYQCSCPKVKVAFQSLTNHANRIIIGAGDAIIAYKIEYSIVDSKFTLKKISDPYRTRYFSSHIKSVGADVIVGDIIKGISRLEMKVKKNITEESDSVFYFQESTKELENVHFLTAIETYNNITITADSLKNVKVYFVGEESSTVVAQFNIGSQINVIKKLDNRKLSSEEFKSVYEGKGSSEHEDIVPMFVMGSVTGGVYLLSFVTATDLIPVLEQSFYNAVKHKQHIVSKEQAEDAKERQFNELIKVKGSRKAYDKPAFGVINGDFIKLYDSELPGKIVDSKCVLL